MFEFAASHAVKVVVMSIWGTLITFDEVKVKVYNCESPGRLPDATVALSIYIPSGDARKYLSVFSFTIK
jgi:hypothetical protein